METFAQEKFRVPAVLLGADLFQHYQDISRHFPPSPEAAAKLLG